MNAQLLAAISGGVAGALVTVIWQLWVTGAREKTALSLRLVHEFLSKSNELAAVSRLLEKPWLAAGDSDSARDNLNRIISLGNWFDVVALCYVKNYLDRRVILDSGIRDLAQDFSERMGKALPDLKVSEHRWVNVRDMCNMHRY